MVAVKSQDDSSSTPYTRMARYYDSIYSKIVDYSSQTDYLEKAIARHSGLKGPGSILDIGCGTGNYTFNFAERGWRATGIDNSGEMVQLAIEKAAKPTNPLFLKMDMRNIDLQTKFDIAIVLFGGFGYVLEPDEVETVFAGVRKQLNPGALLIFEFWQNSAIRPGAARPSGETSWDRAEKGNRLIIRLNTSKYDVQTNILNVRFDFYVIDTIARNLVDNFSETHPVKTYAISHIRELLERSMFKALAFYDGDLGKTKKDELVHASSTTFRVLAVANTVG